MKLFSLTVRKHYKKADPLPSEADFQVVMESLGAFLQQHVFEDDKHIKGGVHMHGVLNLPNNFLRKRLLVKGFNMKMDPIFDINGWVKYMEKDKRLRLEVLDELKIQEYNDQYDAEGSEPDTEIEDL